MSKLTGVKLSEAATAIGSVITATAVLLAYYTLRVTHEWNRRHYTIELASRWNRDARPHLAYLEHEFPQFFAVPDFVKRPHVLTEWKMDVNVALEVCGPKPGDRAIAVRDHLVELFNHLENMAMAYEQHVVDRAAIEDSFGQVMTDAYQYFQPFVDEMRSQNRSDPWPPLSRVVKIWLTEKQRQNAEANAHTAKAQFKAALESAQEKLKRSTESG